MNLLELEGKNKEELLTIAKDMGVEDSLDAMRKDEVVFKLMHNKATSWLLGYSKLLMMDMVF